MFINLLGKKAIENRGEIVLRIVCAGAGYVNIEAAPYLKLQLPQANVTLINRSARHATEAHIPELLAGSVHLDDISVDLETYCKERNVECIIGSITNIDRIKKIVHVGTIEVPYDYLLLDLGSQPETQGIPGIEKAHSRAGPLGMLELRQRIVTQFMKLRETNAPQHRAFVVAGAGVSGIETVTAMHTLIEQLCEKHLIFPHEIVLLLVEQDSTEYPLRASAKRKIEQVLEKKNIEYHNGKVTQFSADGVELGDFTIESETLVWCGRKRASSTLKLLNLPLDEYGAVRVNMFLQTDDPNVFAAGDCARIPQAAYQTIPRTAFMAFDEQRAVADNIIALAKGKRMNRYTPRKPLPIIITTGGKQAMLLTKLYSWHGRIPYKLKQWVSTKYARRIQAKV